jgi:hypothetical protein
MTTPGEYTDNMLHRVYPDPGTIEDMATRDHIAMMMLSHQRAMGKTTSYPFKLAPPQGLAANRADAQTGAGQTAFGHRSTVGEWLVTNGQYKGSVYINDKDIEEGDASNEASYLRAVGLETDGLIEEFGETIETYLWAEPGKYLASVDTAGVHDTNGVITLAVASDAHKFDVGMILVCSANDGATSTDDLEDGVGYVVDVDTDAGTVTVDTTQGGTGASPAAWETASDSAAVYLFRFGDFQGDGAGNTGSTVGTYIIDGFGDWITASRATTTKFNVNRGRDSRLSGVRVTGAGPIEKRLKDLGTRIATTSGKKGKLTGFLYDDQWQALCNELESRGITPVEKTAQGKKTTFGYSSISLVLPSGMAEIIPTSHCGPTTGWLLNLKHWNLCATKAQFPRVMNADGFRMLRRAADDSYEFRITCYGHLATPYPSFHGRVGLAALS